MKIIAIDGPTGVGKSTTAVALADALGVEAVLDPVSHSPLLDDYYVGFDTPEGALRLEMEFLRMRHELLEDIGLADRDHGPRAVVTDFSLIRSGPFAELLTVAEHRDLVVADMWRRYEACPRLDVLMLLRAEPEMLLERVRTRKRPAEEALSLDHLRELEGHFDAWDAELRAQADTVIVLDTHEWDGLDADDLEALIARLDL